MDFPTFQDLLQIGSAEVLARNKNLSVDAVQRQGTDANALVAAGAAVGDEVIGQLADLSAGLFLDSSVGVKLDRLVFDRYGLIRKPASAATGSVQFTTTAPNAAAFSIPVGLQVQTPTGQVFITTAAETFQAGVTGPITVAVRSTLAGIDQQAAAHTITSIQGSVPNSPTDLVVDNPLATAGAADDESDPALRGRARQFFPNARRGTLGAIKSGALAVEGVTSANVTEVLGTLGQPARVVQLVVTDQFTVALAELGQNPPAYQAQSQVLGQRVFEGLDEFRAAGIYVQVQVAQVILLPLQFAFTFSAGANIDSVTRQAIAVAIDYVNSIDPGTTFDPSKLSDPTSGIFSTIVGLIVSGGEVVSPAGPVVPTSLQAIRTSPELVAAVSAVPGVQLQTSTNPDA